MPISVQEYHVGQLYMIARHSKEQSGGGEGVEVVENRQCEDPEHGCGVYTEKRIHLSTRLPYWVQSLLPKVFYITEKAWNYYPFTITEYNCSFLPRFSISIKTCYENNSGSSENALKLSQAEAANRIVEHIDIAYDEVSPKHYKEEEDPRFFQSSKTHRGPLVEGWRTTHQPIMCSYKLVSAYFEVWGLQTRVEEFIHSCIKEVLLVGHRQAFAWIDDWIDMSYPDVRKYEMRVQAETNSLVQTGGDPEKCADAAQEDTAASGDAETRSEPRSEPRTPLEGYFSGWFSS